MESEIYYINMDGNIYFKVDDGVVCSQGAATPGSQGGEGAYIKKLTIQQYGRSKILLRTPEM